MGVEYQVICRDCGIYQDLDKFGDGMQYIRNRECALDLSKEFEKPGLAFRAALLTSFMFEHMGHNCTLVNESTHEDATEGLKLHPSNAWEV